MAVSSSVPRRMRPRTRGGGEPHGGERLRVRAGLELGETSGEAHRRDAWVVPIPSPQMPRFARMRSHVAAQLGKNLAAHLPPLTLDARGRRSLVPARTTVDAIRRTDTARSTSQLPPTAENFSSHRRRQARSPPTSVCQRICRLSPARAIRPMTPTGTSLPDRLVTRG